MPETTKPDELTQFASTLQSMKQRALDLHLHATAQRLDWVVRMLGSEISEKATDSGPQEAVQAVPATMPSANGQDLSCREATPCPDCRSTEFEVRTYGGSWDDADFHCAGCGRLIHRAWFPMKTG